MTAGFRIVLVGDAMMAVEFEGGIDPAVNARVVCAADAIHAAGVDGVRDVVPTYRSVAVHFDPLKTDVAALRQRLTREGARAASAEGTYRETDRGEPTLKIPVCYGGSFGPDLDEVAARAGMPASEVVARHSTPTYRVFMLGFLPGFAYMGLVDARIAAPRRETPRARVSAGSVGIAGTQTGIYPCESPGGWQIIGRTPVRPYDPESPERFLLQAGDRVTFYPIAEDEYERSAGTRHGIAAHH